MARAPGLVRGSGRSLLWWRPRGGGHSHACSVGRMEMGPVLSTLIVALLLLTQAAVDSGAQDGDDQGEAEEPWWRGGATDELPAPTVRISLLGGGADGPIQVPVTHMLDVDILSFDPAAGYLEIWEDGALVSRMLDPTSTVMSLHHGHTACQPPPGQACWKVIHAKLFSFEAPAAPVALDSVHFALRAATAKAPACALPSHAEADASVPQPWLSDNLDLSQAATTWPLPCSKAVPFPGFPPMSAYVQRPRLFLAQPPHDLGWMYFDPEEVVQCDPPCLWFLELSCPQAADVLVFSCTYTQGKHGGGAPRVEKLPHQRFLHLCVESTGGRRDEAFLGAMDMHATFQLSSDVPFTYVPGNAGLFQRGPVAAASKAGFGMFVISNCGLERDIFLRQVMTYAHVDSFGKCLNNARFPEADLRRGQKGLVASPLTPLMSRYKFVFSFESARERDYVTEKLYIPLMAGSVPVYMGAPNVAEFVPHPRSFIDASAYESPRHLAEYLLYLDGNDTAYEEYHKWRQEPWGEAFVALQATAMNRGSVYNEGVVHGTAQRISPARVSNAHTHTHKHQAGVEALGLECGGLGVDILSPKQGGVLHLHLLGGVRVEVALREPLLPSARMPSSCSAPVTVIVLVGGTVYGTGELDSCVTRRNISLEFLPPGTHAISAELLCPKQGRGRGSRGAVSKGIIFELVGVAAGCKGVWGVCAGGSEAWQRGECFQGGRDEGLGGYVVYLNMERQPERNEHVQKMLQGQGIRNLSRVEAVDGGKVSLHMRRDGGMGEGPEWLFRRNHFGLDRHVMGAAMSHVGIWLSAAECLDDLDWVLIFEDDVWLPDDFVQRFTHRLQRLNQHDRDWDYVCVGARGDLGEYVDFDDFEEVPGVMRIRNYRVCYAHAYIVKKSAAQAFLDMAAQEGVGCAIDWYIAIHSQRLQSYAFMPSLAGQHPQLSTVDRQTAHWGAGSLAASGF